MLRTARFGELIRCAGLDTARAYLPPRVQTTSTVARNWFRRKR